MDMMNTKLMQRFLRDVSLGFLAQHLIFAALFGSCQHWPTSVVNLVCAVAAAVSWRLSGHDHFRAQFLTVYITELAYLIFSAVCLGCGAGFQLPLVGLTLLAFFAEYLGRTLDYKPVPALPLSAVNFAVYVLVLAPRFHSPGLLPLPEKASLSLQLIWSGAIFALCIAGLQLTVRMNSDSERILASKAESDRLTGLYNRAGYDKLLSRLDLKTTTLLLVDADKFKHVNDTYGHVVGDQVLKKIAAALRQNFRRVDCVCRVGGDEFVVLMLNTEKPEQEMLVRKVWRINRELSHTEDGLPLISVSVGIAYGCDAADWKELFVHADEALYQVKQNGGRDCRFYTNE